jgi:transglutaminase-like putative cysteine protease
MNQALERHSQLTPAGRRSSSALRAAASAALLLLAPLVGANAAPADHSWVVAPPASWIRELPLPAADTPLKAGADSGRLYLLVDHQARLGGPVVDYSRFAWTPLSTAGVQNASEIQVHFDPAYQRLVVHHVRLLRNGKDVFAFRPSDVRVIQQERSLDEQIYSGELTAVVFLRDLRPGDVVDYAYSLEGTNPIVGASYDDELALAYESPVRVIRHVIDAPEHIVIHIKAQHTALTPRVVTADGRRTYTWEARDVPATVADDEEPGWFDPDPRIEISTFGSWAEVADWARGLFETQIMPSAEIRQLAGEFRATPGGPAAAAAAAVRFVPDEVRYLGLEMGPSSPRPHPPEQVLRQRFGDCKDKSLLLVALLRELGVDAAPALVDTERRRGLDQIQPSPFAFDHAIVRAVVAGRELWIDATESDMGGRLEDRDPPEFERALVLAPGTNGLTPIPLAAPDEPTVGVKEIFTLSRENGPARLDVVTTYRRTEADTMRNRLATTPPQELAKSYLDDYARDEADIKALAPPAATDDRQRNIIVVTESYEMSSFWKNRKRELHGWEVSDHLPKSVASSRKTPLSVPHPVHVRHEVIVRAQSRFHLGPYHEDVRSEALSFTAALAAEGQEMRLTFDYRSLADAVLPEHIKTHQQSVHRVEDAISFLVLPDLTSPDAPEERWVGTPLIGGAALAAGALLAIVAGLRARRRRTGRAEVGSKQ